MKVNQLLEKTDQMKPNSFETADKLDWLNTLEKIVYREIIATHENGKSIPEPQPYTATSEDDLLLPDPYSQVYLYYLMMQIDLFNGEIDRYNNTAHLFNTAYQWAGDGWNRTHPPAFRQTYIL